MFSCLHRKKNGKVIKINIGLIILPCRVEAWQLLSRADYLPGSLETSLPVLCSMATSLSNLLQMQSLVLAAHRTPQQLSCVQAAVWECSWREMLRGTHMDLTCTFISLSVSQMRIILTSPEVMSSPVSCSQSTTIPAPRRKQRQGV